MYGCTGKILRVNLTDKAHRTETLCDDFYRTWLGGRGLIAKILYDELDPSVDPLGPDNKLIMASGPLTGVYLPASGKLEFGAKSPATGGYGDSNMGGHMAPELKYAGYDAVIFEGASDQPCYVVIDDDRVEIRPATSLWGQGTFATEKALKDELGEEFQICVIGPAGENLIKFACIQHDFGRQAGRTGIGAVMGSKKIKAVAVRGSKTIPVADASAVLAKGQQMYKGCFEKPGFEEWTPMGTAGVTNWVNEVGAFPTHNFKTSYFEGHQGINGEALKERILKTDKGCFGCPTPCGKYSRTKVKIKDKKFEVHVEGPEYETIALIGGNCELATIEETAYANYVMDDLGLDTISGGNVAAFAMECFERGVITADQFDGRELRFGDLESVVYLSEIIARRQGLGDILAEGVKVAAERFGKDSQRYAIHIKGLEQSGYEARWAPAMMLAYMTADVGAHHNRAWAITHDVAVGRDQIEGKAAKVVELQHIRPLFDALGICRLQWVELGFELYHYGEMFKAVTGVDYSWDDLLKVSERIFNLTRMFWVKHMPGFGRSWDYPPARMIEEETPTGPSKGKRIPLEDLDRLLDDYYTQRGWSLDGIPTKETLEALGLGELAVALPTQTAAR